MNQPSPTSVPERVVGLRVSTSRRERLREILASPIQALTNTVRSFAVDRTQPVPGMAGKSQRGVGFIEVVALRQVPSHLGPQRYARVGQAKRTANTLYKEFLVALPRACPSAMPSKPKPRLAYS